MSGNLLRKGLVVGIIILFIGLNITASVPGEIGNNSEDLRISDIETRSLSTADWWPMFHHDLNHSGYSTADTPETNKVTWTYATGDWVYSSPAVSDGKVYIGSDDGNVYCLDADDGIEKWNYTTGYWADSSPAVSDGKVFIGSLDYKVYCLDAGDGTEIWTYATGGWVYSSPAVSDGKVFIGSWDGNVYCLDADDGTEIWTYATGAWVWSSPAVCDGKVYIGSGDYKVYCLDAGDGTEVWTYATGGWVDSSPAVSDGKIYIGSFDGKVYCLDASYGTEIWNYATGDRVDSSPAVSNGKLYIGSFDGKVYCLDASYGSEIWNYPTGENVRSSPAVSNGKVFIGSLDGKVYCFGDDGVNHRPDVPTIDGPTSGNAGTEYDYVFNSVDPDGDDVYYYIKWGDGHVEIWDGPYTSGVDANITHTYANQGTFIIEAKAKDTEGLESDWGILTVTMPRNKEIYNSLFLRLLEQYPLLEIFLSIIINPLR